MVELTKHIFKITTRTPIRVNKPTDDKMESEYQTV